MGLISDLWPCIYPCSCGVCVWSAERTGPIWLPFGADVRIAVCYNNRLTAFPIWLSQRSEGGKASYHKVKRSKPHSLFIFFLPSSGDIKPLFSPPFLLPPARLNFRNLLNLLPIDFPPEFPLLLKIQQRKQKVLPTLMQIHKTYIHTHSLTHMRMQPHRFPFKVKWKKMSHTHTHTKL